ncbi:MAG: helix-turn-helix transcriptional regulator [Pseudonocardiaceae bacterium]
MDPSATSRTGPDHLPAVAALAAVAALSDELRRRMYGFIRQARRPVSREEAARTVGISRKLAAFHLDKLVEVGLLRAGYEPVGGIRKVGRTPKVYEPTNAEVHISIPARDHDLLAGILMDALLTQDLGKTGHEAALQIARHRGAALGAAERERSRPGRLSAERALRLATATLARYGFEPDRAAPTLLRLRNCPFQPLASKAPQLVCGINHAFLTGFLDTLQAPTLTAVLAPRAGECCVELTAG